MSSMNRSLANSTVTRQERPCDRYNGERSHACDPDFLVDLFNQAIDESSWSNKQEALATAMGLDRSYLSRIRSKDKPLQQRHIVALPDDVEAIFAKLYAESFGLVVVVPARGHDAVKQLVAGLLGVLPQVFPEKAGPPLKASLRSDR